MQAFKGLKAKAKAKDLGHKAKDLRCQGRGQELGFWP